MIIVMERGASDEQVRGVVERLHAQGLSEHVSRGAERTLIGAIGDERRLMPEAFESLPGVERAMRVMRAYRMVSRESQPEDSRVPLRGFSLGGKESWQCLAGTAQVESREQMEAIAAGAKAAGCRALHGGVFARKPNPYGFAGLGLPGLDLLCAAARGQGLAVLAELPDVRLLEEFLRRDVDMLHIAGRNMGNVELLRELSKLNKPVLLERAAGASMAEWLMAAEFIAAGGNHNIALCERGEQPGGGHGLDVAALLTLRRETHLPLLVDVSHAGGKAWMASALARSALACGAAGLLLDVHPQPAQSRSEPDCALPLEELAALFEHCRNGSG